MDISVAKIIQGHKKIAPQKDGCIRLVEVWVNSEPPYISSLVVTAFDLFYSLFGDCVYSMFANPVINEPRALNFFQIPLEPYTEWMNCLSQYISVKKCSVKPAFRDVIPKGMVLLSKIAYDITVSRVWKVKQISLDPVYNPHTVLTNPKLTQEILLYHQSLIPYIIKDVIGIILVYSIDPCFPNHLRCSKEDKNKTRCNQLRIPPSWSCREHQHNQYFLSNHYL